MAWNQLELVLQQGAHRHWLSLSLLLITVLVISASILIRHLLKKRWRALLAQDGDEETCFEEPAALDDLDREALAVIGKYRRETWQLPESKLTLSTEFLIQRTLEVIRSIAAVYHPENTAPEYEASFDQSVQLAHRVIYRLHRLTRFTPFRVLSSRKLSEYQRFYRLYRQINDNLLVQAVKRHRRLYRVAGWIVSARHLANPFYWAGKDLSREGYFYLLRWFHATYLSQVGREAMRLYSGRPFGSLEQQEATQIGYRLFEVCTRWGGPSSGEWAAWVELVSKMPHLEAEAKLSLLRNCAGGQVPVRAGAVVEIQTRFGKKFYPRALRKLAKAEPVGLSMKQTTIEQELETQN